MNTFEELCKYCEENKQQFLVFYNCVNKEYEVSIPVKTYTVEGRAHTLDLASKFAWDHLQKMKDPY